MARTRDFCFTWNNYDLDSIELLRSLECRYIVFGVEKAPTTGTPHLQGYVSFENAKTLSAVIKILKGAHVEIRRRSALEASTYCKKDGEFEERGVLPMSPHDKGQASKEQWETVLELARADKLEEIPAQYLIPHYNTLNQIAMACRFDCTRFIVDHPLRPWQRQLVDELSGQPNDRTIIWYVDEDGGAGKTYLSKYLQQEHGAHYFRAAKSADMAHYLNVAPIYIFDLPRAVEEHPPYPFLEALKDGLVFSSKYQSHMKKVPLAHLVVFANWHPETRFLSKDRWDIRYLKNGDVNQEAHPKDLGSLYQEG